MTNTDRFNRAIFPDLAMKAPAILASTGNLTLSGEQTIDGSTTNETRVIAKDQTNAWENGVYRTGTGSWTRENDFNGNRSLLKGTTILATNGTMNAGKYFQVSSTGSVTGGYHAITGSSTGDTVTIGVANLFAAQQLFGTLWNFDTSTSMADPGSMDIRFNHATLSSVTAIAVSATTLNGTDLSDWIATWDDSTSSNRGTLRIQEAGSPSNFAVFNINGAITDNSTWLQIPVAHVISGGSFASGDDLVVSFSASGSAGADGAGVPSGGSTNQIIVKTSTADNATAWAGTTAIDLIRHSSHANLSVGYTCNLHAIGTVSTGTHTVDLTGTAMKSIVMGGAFTFAPSTQIGAAVYQVSIASTTSPTLTTSGWTKVYGDTFSATSSARSYLFQVFQFSTAARYLSIANVST